MPVIEITGLEAVNELKEENSELIVEYNPRKGKKVMNVLLVNLMPTKAATEKQFLRLLAQSSQLVDVTLLHMETHVSKNTSQEHIDTFYQSFSDIKNRKFDGMIITGAPLENINFSQVDFFEEFTNLLEWSRNHVTSTLYICWGAQAALHYFHGIERILLDDKVFGIYEHQSLVPDHPLTKGSEDNLYIPHSRHTSFNRQDLEDNQHLDIIVDSEEAGATILVNEKTREIFITGHPEYDRETLELEYRRDQSKGLPIQIPENYYPDDDPSRPPSLTWQETAKTFYTNWLNHYALVKTENY